MLFSIREKVFLIEVGMGIKNTHYQYCKKNKKSDFFHDYAISHYTQLKKKNNPTSHI